MRLRELRISKGWSGPTAAARAGFSPSLLSRLERGRLSLKVEHVEAIRAGWGLTATQVRDLVRDEAEAAVAAREGSAKS